MKLLSLQKKNIGLRINDLLFIKCYLFKLFVTLIFLMCLIFKNVFMSKANKTNKKKIFTFWEPQETIPGYIHLCINTWKKFLLSDYEILQLNFKKVKDYLGENLFSKIMFSQLSLQMQADAIRVALLKVYGGIWMDADTIITNGSFLKGLGNYELVMIGDEKRKGQHIGFLYAPYNSRIINLWFNEIIKRIEFCKQYTKKNNKTLKLRWNYLGNEIIDELIKNITKNEFLRLDRYKMFAVPEFIFIKNSSLNFRQKYKHFYFQPGNPNIVLNSSKGIILLHNSFTPSRYMKMSINEFLNTDILISRLLANILGISHNNNSYSYSGE